MGNDFLKWRKYMAGNGYWLLCMEEKLVIASYNNPSELVNQRPEMFNAYRP